MKGPALFISHGSPMVAIEHDRYTDMLSEVGSRLDKLKAVVILSAHGMSNPDRIQIGASPNPRLIYDFGGFPDALYEITYACAGAPGVAKDALALLSSLGAQASLDASMKLDHGVWVPLRLLLPKADLPVVQVSMPYPSHPKNIYEIGHALRPLRDHGVLLIGSGGAVHNLRRLAWTDKAAPPETWAREFDAWLRDCVENRRLEALFDYEKIGPHAAMAHPTPDHLLPLFFTLGTLDSDEPIETICDEFQYANLSMYSFAAGLN